jgi:putative transposase
LTEAVRIVARVAPEVALEIMPDQVHQFVKAHLSDCPSRIASQFRGFTSRRLRTEFPHLWSRLLALEKLSTAGMTRRPAPKPDPVQPGVFLPNTAAAKAGLSKAILDASWAQFATILTAKAESAGRRVVFVNPAGTSITCHLCGQECTRPRQDTVICPAHGTIDADVNGARNIATRAGLGSGQASAA